jgi:hypothetical protein
MLNMIVTIGIRSFHTRPLLYPNSKTIRITVQTSSCRISFQIGWFGSFIVLVEMSAMREAEPASVELQSEARLRAELAEQEQYAA